MEVSVEVQSKDYFSNLNALAQKIATDIEQTQEAYQNLWHSLSREEQNQVIDESIISPSAVLKYAYLDTPMVRDSPHIYSWFSKSQLDLFNQNNFNREPHVQTVVKKHNYLIPMDSPTKEIKNVHYELPTGEESKAMYQEERCSTSSKSQTAASHKSSVLKPKTPPPPPPLKLSVCVGKNQNDEFGAETVTNDIPKTGFDFLDNW